MSNSPKGSRIWNFMLKCQPIINNNLTWGVGKGNEALFWEDSWDDQAAADNYNLSRNIKNTLTQSRGTKIINCRYRKEGNGEDNY